MGKLATLREEYTVARQDIDKLFKAYPEMEFQPDVATRLDSLIAEADRLETEVKRAEHYDEAQRKTLAEIDRLTVPVTRMVHPTGGTLDASGRSQQAGPPIYLGTKTVGQRFIEDERLVEYLRQAAPHGQVNEKQRIHSPAVEFGALTKALITGTSDTSAGAFVFNDVKPGVMLPTRPLTVRDFITIGTTTGDTVEYVRQTSQTNNAAPVIEATGVSGGVGVKPESDLALEKVTTAVKTIAHWIAATKRALSDAGQMRTLIDNFLRYGLEEELEDQIINGSGAGENFTGILNTSGTTAQAWDTDLLVTTRKAKTKARVTGRAVPTGSVLNPEDWERIDLLKDNEARYYAGGPFTPIAPRLWGLNVIESEAMPAGTGIVGDLRQMVLWDREQASILVTDSHSDFFIKNLVAILAEMRAAFGVLRPAAIVEMDLTA